MSWACCVSSAAVTGARSSAKADASIWWWLTLSLRLRRLHPPNEVVGKARERAFKGLATFTNWFALRRQGLSNRTHSNRARDHDHPHLGEYTVPRGCRPRTGEATGRIARNRGRPPKPLLQKMVGEVFQSGLNAPIILAGDEHEPVGAADLAGELRKGLGGISPRIFFEHPVEHRQVDRLGVDQLNVLTPAPQPPHHKLSEPDTHPVRTIGAIKNENAMAHCGSSLPACSAIMYSAYQSGQFLSRTPPVLFSCSPCAASARRSALASSAREVNVVSSTSTRPGKRVVISCSSQLLPSGSLNEAYET